MKAIQDQVPEPVQAAMNDTHSVFEHGSDSSQSMETLSRQWKYFMLDFSGVNDVAELSAKVLFADAGDTDVLDYDVIQVNSNSGDTHVLLGFKVGCIELDGKGGGRKVARQGAKRSVLANKLAGLKSMSSPNTSAG
jgi:hypothetical protein